MSAENPETTETQAEQPEVKPAAESGGDSGNGGFVEGQLDASEGAAVLDAESNAGAGAIEGDSGAGAKEDASGTNEAKVEEPAYLAEARAIGDDLKAQGVTLKDQGVAELGNLKPDATPPVDTGDDEGSQERLRSLPDEKSDDVRTPESSQANDKDAGSSMESQLNPDEGAAVLDAEPDEVAAEADQPEKPGGSAQATDIFKNLMSDFGVKDGADSTPTPGVGRTPDDASRGR